MSARQILGLDALRFATAMMVAFLHLGWISWAPDAPALGQALPAITQAADLPAWKRDVPWMPELAPYAWFGWVGVQIFFVISGFVIALTAESRSAAQFFGARFLRLMPAIWLCATITFVTLIAVDHFNMDYLKQYLRTMTMEPLHFWVPFIDIVYWTLEVEIVFYGMIFFLLLAGLSRALSHFAIVLGLVGALTRIAGELFPQLQPHLWFGFRQADILLAWSFYFALGMLIWRCFFKQATLLSHITIALCLVAAGLEIATYASSYTGRPGVTLNPLAPELMFFLGVGAMAASIAFRDQIYRVAGQYAPIFRAFGVATYPLYLLHYRVGTAIMGVCHRLGAPPLLGFLIAFGVVICAAFVIALVWEPMVRVVLRRAGDWVQALSASMRKPAGASPSK